MPQSMPYFRDVMYIASLQQQPDPWGSWDRKQKAMKTRRNPTKFAGATIRTTKTAEEKITYTEVEANDFQIANW